MKTAKEIADKIYNDEYYAGKAEQAIKEYAREACKEQRAKDVKSMIDGNCADIRFITETDLIELK